MRERHLFDRTAPSFAIARIDESACIGCGLCVAACPVDAIVGAAKLIHTVLAERCTGCELCLPPCPVDCIAMLPAGRSWTAADERLARARSVARKLRLGIADPVGGDGAAAAQEASVAAARSRRQAAIAAALVRARARRSRRAAGRA